MAQQEINTLKDKVEELREILRQMCFCKQDLDVIIKDGFATVSYPPKICRNELVRKMAFKKITEIEDMELKP